MNKLTINILVLLCAGSISSLASPAIADASGGGFLNRLFERKAEHMGPVVNKIGELRERGFIWNLDFSPDGRYLAANDPLGLEVHIWDWQGEGHIIRTLMKPHGTGNTATNCLRYSPDGRLLALFHKRSAREDGFTVLRVWNSVTGQIVHENSEPFQGGTNYGVAFTADGNFMISTSDRNTSVPGDQMMVQRTDNWNQEWGLHIDRFYPETLGLSPDGKTVAMGGHAYVPVAEPRGTHYVIHTQIAVVDWDRRAVIRTIDEVFPVINGDLTSANMTALAWNPDGIHVAVGTVAHGGQDAVKVFDITTGKAVASETAIAHITDLVYTPDGKYLIEAGLSPPDKDPAENVEVRIWDGSHKNLLQTIPVRAGALAVSRDGRYLALGEVNKISLWEINNHAPVSMTNR